MVPLMPTVMITRGRICRPCWVSFGWSIVHLSNLLVVASMGNVSLQYVNSKICILRWGLGEYRGLGEYGGVVVGGALIKHSMAGMA